MLFCLSPHPDRHLGPIEIRLNPDCIVSQALAEHCRKALAPAAVHAPARGVTVDCSAASAAYKVRLTEELMAAVVFKVCLPSTSLGFGFQLLFVKIESKRLLTGLK